MEKQRLRNLTTGRLHTEMGHVYEDLEFITGERGLMTHQLPNIMRAVLPWLRGKIQDPEYWDKQHRPELSGEHPLEPMSEAESRLMLERYMELPHPFEGKEVVAAVVGQ